MPEFVDKFHAIHLHFAPVLEQSQLHIATYIGRQ